AVAVADLNYDGKLDIVVTNDSGPGNAGTIAVLQGKGDGTFAPFTTFPTGMGPHGIAVGDFNGDGLPDIVTATKDEYTITILINGPTFGAPPAAAARADLQRLDSSVALNIMVRSHSGVAQWQSRRLLTAGSGVRNPPPEPGPEAPFPGEAFRGGTAAAG